MNESLFVHTVFFYSAVVSSEYWVVSTESSVVSTEFWVQVKIYKYQNILEICNLLDVSVYWLRES